MNLCANSKVFKLKLDMKSFILIAVVHMALLYNTQLNAQAYYEIAESCSQEVLEEMNSNKRNAIVILTNIIGAHTIELSDLKKSEIRSLKKVLKSEINILDFELPKKSTQLKIMSNATFTTTDVENLLVGINEHIIKHTTTYQVQK